MKENETLVERSQRGMIGHASEVYGESHDGIPLSVWLPGEGRPAVLVLASMHGDESETTVVLSDALRSIRAEDLKNAAILCANPDGLVRGTRGNARGVDLNRNFPATNWSPEPVFYKSRENGPRDISLSPGTHPASEPETSALLALLERIKPRAIVTLHAALACIDDADELLFGEAARRKNRVAPGTGDLSHAGFVRLLGPGARAEPRDL